MFETKKEQNTIVNSVVLFILFLLLLFVLYLSFQNKTIKKELEILTIDNNELNGKYDELENLCNLQEEQIETLEKELEISLAENEENIKKDLSYIEPLKKLDKMEYLIQYKKIMKNYENVFINYMTLENTFTKNEIMYMYRCIETETFGAKFEGKVNVASVILNRVKSKSFPSDPISVVTSPSQFAYGRTHISEETMLALEYAFIIGDTTNGAIAFRSDCSPNQWGKWDYIFTDEIGHSFYK